MNIDLAIIGRGAVTPGGIGLAEGDRAPVTVPVAPVGRPKKTWPVFRIDLRGAPWERWQREPRLRRASPLTYFLVEAAEQALREFDASERAATGLIVALSAGCLAYSCRFYRGLVTQGPRAASPALFPETVFNSPGSHVIAVHGLNGAAYALVGDEGSWAGALQTAAVWLRRGRVRQVLVLGGEEFDPLVLDAYRCAGWLRPGGGFRASEGAAGVLVRAARPGDPLVIAEARDGFLHRSLAERRAAAARLAGALDPAVPCLAAAPSHPYAALASRTLANHAQPGGEGPDLGEAFLASAAWRTLRACAMLESGRPRLVQPLWGLNHQFGYLDLRHRV